MNENGVIFSCGHSNPVFFVTYSVAGEEKTYSICKLCEELEYFKKFIVKKVRIDSSSVQELRTHSQVLQQEVCND